MLLTLMTLFLKNQAILFPIETFRQFFTFSVLKPDPVKSAIARLGALKRLKVTVCGMKCIYLGSGNINILGIFFSHDET